MKDYVIKSIVELAFTVLGAVIVTVLLPAITAWFKSKTDNEKMKAVITDISNAVATCVNYAEQTIVSSLKSDGKWNSETQLQVFELVTENVTNMLLSTTKEIIENNGMNLENIVAQYIEAYIQSKKTTAIGENKDEDNQE